MSGTPPSSSPPGLQRTQQGTLIPRSPFTVEEIHDIDERSSYMSSVGAHSPTALEDKIARLEKQIEDLKQQPTSEDVTRLATSVENATLSEKFPPRIMLR